MFILAAQFALLALFAHITDAMGKRLDAAERRIVAQTNRLDDAERSIHKLKTNHQSSLEDVQRKLRDLRIRQHKQLQDVETRIVASEQDIGELRSNSEIPK